jgi:hypothetical protein
MTMAKSKGQPRPKPQPEEQTPFYLGVVRPERRLSARAGMKYPYRKRWW